MPIETTDATKAKKGQSLEIRKLNTLRGMAALIVFVTHFSDITHWFGGALGGGAGAYGVMLFFLLSGFLMSYLYSDKDYNKSNIKDYLLARIGRVVPLYLLVVVGSFVLSTSGANGLYNIPDVGSLIGHLLFLSGESVLWTIPAEIQFYFIFIIFWGFEKNRAGYIYVAMIATMIILYLTNFPRIFGDINGVPYNVFSVLRTLPYFFIGVIMGMHYKSAQIPRYLRKDGFLLVLCLIPLLYPEFSPVNTSDKTRMWLSYEVLLVMSTVFFCIVYLVPDNNICMANKLGDFIGKISYSLYLLHMPIIEIVNQFELAIGIKLILSLSLSIVVAYISFTCIEKPAARMIRGFGSNKSLPNNTLKEVST